MTAMATCKRLSRACTALATLFIATLAWASDSRDESSDKHPAAHVLSTGTMIGAQGRMRKLAREGKVPQPVADCVGRLHADEFDALYETFIEKGLTPDEVRLADEFWRSPVGRRKFQAMLVATYGLYGEKAFGASSGSLSKEDVDAFDRFSASSAGIKLQALSAEGDEAPMGRAVRVRLTSLFEACHDATGMR
jgi:hypothetical protein